MTRRTTFTPLDSSRTILTNSEGFTSERSSTEYFEASVRHISFALRRYRPWVGRCSWNSSRDYRRNESGPGSGESLCRAFERIFTAYLNPIHPAFRTPDFGIGPRYNQCPGSTSGRSVGSRLPPQFFLGGALGSNFSQRRQHDY